MTATDSAADGALSSPVLFPDLTRDDVLRIETRRLWLRWPRHADLAAFEGFVSQAKVAEMTGSFPHPLPRGEAERRIFEARKANATGTGLILAITTRGAPNTQIGSVGLTATHGPNGEGEAELGYMLDPAHWGQGLAAEAAQALLDTAFNYTAIGTVSAWVRVSNPASRRVLEKCGFRQVGMVLRDMPARGGRLPCDEFMLDRKTWAALVNWRGVASGGPAARGEPAPSVPASVLADRLATGDMLTGVTLNSA